MFKIWKQVWICKGSGTYQYDLNFEPLSEYWYATTKFFQTQFTRQLRQDGSVRAFTINTATATAGAKYQASVFVFRNTPSGFNFGEYRLIVNILPSPINVAAQNCFNTYNNCCLPGGVHIQWLNQVGGMQNYYFNGVRTFEVSQEDSRNYIDYNNISRYSDRGEVYQGETVSTKAIPKSHVDLLDSLRYSIQAYVVETVTDNPNFGTGFKILNPIRISPDSFTKYKSNEKKFDVYLNFIYADPVKIQTQ